MNRLHMTDEDWNQYLMEDNNVAIQWANDLKQYTKSGGYWASVKIKRTIAELQKIEAFIDNVEKAEQTRIQEGFMR